ncbi:coiled-coil domain-containing protein 167 [Rhinophrynus dorsalis]
MEKKKKNLSGIREIDRMQEKLESCKRSLDDTDFKLRKLELTKEEERSLEKKKNSLTNKISHYERELKSLRHENRKNMLVSVAIFLLLALVYYGWTM